MASYKVILRPSVEKDLRSIPKAAIARVIKQLDLLAEDPFPRQALKLEGAEQLYRARVGEYRIVYSVDRAAKNILVQ